MQTEVSNMSNPTETKAPVEARAVVSNHLRRKRAGTGRGGITVSYDDDGSGHAFALSGRRGQARLPGYRSPLMATLQGDARCS